MTRLIMFFKVGKSLVRLRIYFQSFDFLPLQIVKA